MDFVDQKTATAGKDAMRSTGLLGPGATAMMMTSKDVHKKDAEGQGRSMRRSARDLQDEMKHIEVQGGSVMVRLKMEYQEHQNHQLHAEIDHLRRRIKKVEK